MKKIIRVFTLAFLFLSVPLLLASNVSAQEADSWPMFHRDPAHTGYVNLQGPTTNQPIWIYSTPPRCLQRHDHDSLSYNQTENIGMMGM